MFRRSSPGSRKQRSWQPAAPLGVKYCICLSASVHFPTTDWRVPIATACSWLAAQTWKKLAKSSSRGTCLTSAVAWQTGEDQWGRLTQELKTSTAAAALPQPAPNFGGSGRMLANMYCYLSLWSSVILEPRKTCLRLSNYKRRMIFILISYRHRTWVMHKATWGST